MKILRIVLMLVIVVSFFRLTATSAQEMRESCELNLIGRTNMDNVLLSRERWFSQGGFSARDDAVFKISFGVNGDSIQLLESNLENVINLIEPQPEPDYSLYQTSREIYLVSDSGSQSQKIFDLDDYVGYERYEITGASIYDPVELTNLMVAMEYEGQKQMFWIPNEGDRPTTYEGLFNPRWEGSILILNKEFHTQSEVFISTEAFFQGDWISFGHYDEPPQILWLPEYRIVFSLGSYEGEYSIEYWSFFKGFPTYLGNDFCSQ